MSKFKSRKEIAEELGISVRTLRRKTQQCGVELPDKALVSPAEEEHIKSALNRIGQNQTKSDRIGQNRTLQ